GSSTSKSIGEAGSIHDETKNVETDPKRQTSGYVVDTVIFDNMIRIRRSLIPFQVAYAIFFATALGILLVLFRPSELSAGYLFALVIIGIAIAIFSHQAIKTSSRGSAI
ncbi:MAG: hypothetical protein ACREBQ_11430, partial [Nitrososphaerales archaeon]